MADKNIQMTQRNAENTGWDNLYPITKAENVKTSDGSDLAAHLADFTQHIEDDSAHGIGDKSQLLTADKSSIVNAINEVFTLGNNVKSDTVTALLSVDDTLPISSESAWSDIITAIGNINTGFSLVAGSDLNIYEDTTLKTVLNESYVKVREVTINKSGSVRVTFNLGGGSSDTGVIYNGRIYINNNPVGIERSRNNTTVYSTYTEDFNVNQGDKIQLFIKTNSAMGSRYAQTNLFKVSIQYDLSPYITKVI